MIIVCFNFSKRCWNDTGLDLDMFFAVLNAEEAKLFTLKVLTRCVFHSAEHFMFLPSHTDTEVYSSRNKTKDEQRFRRVHSCDGSFSVVSCLLSAAFVFTALLTFIFILFLCVRCNLAYFMIFQWQWDWNVQFDTGICVSTGFLRLPLLELVEYGFKIS